MTGDFTDAIGTAAEGALYARTVEPAAGEGDGHTHERACLTWKPGKLTREYIDGRRARYVSPIALFLFTIFVTFALWSAFGALDNVNTDAGPATREQMQASLSDMDEDIARSEKDLATAKAEGADVAAIETELESTRNARQLMATLMKEGGGALDAAGDPDTFTTEAGPGIGGWLKSAWQKTTANPKLLLYKLQTNAYKLSWLLIPLSLPFMWLLFPFSRRFRMYDHTVFVTYSISFMTMLVVVASLGAYWQITPLVVVPILYAPLHLYRQLRGTYGLGRLGAVWRLLVLSVLIYVVLVLFVLLMVGLVISH